MLSARERDFPRPQPEMIHPGNAVVEKRRFLPTPRKCQSIFTHTRTCASVLSSTLAPSKLAVRRVAWVTSRLHSARLFANHFRLVESSKVATGNAQFHSSRSPQFYIPSSQLRTFRSRRRSAPEQKPAPSSSFVDGLGTVLRAPRLEHSGRNLDRIRGSGVVVPQSGADFHEGQEEQAQGESTSFPYSERMKSHVEVVTTPTADTPGTSVLLEFQDKRYVIGNAHEGAQRAMMQRGKRLNKITEIFLTGKTEWKNTGGLLGLILTTADSRMASRQASYDVFTSKRSAKLEKLDKEIAALGEKSKQKAKKILEREKEEGALEPFLKEHAAAKASDALGIHGGPNISYTIATARRFIFRKGMPLKVHESAFESDPKDRKPDWTDENIQVYKMALLPENEASHDEVLSNNSRKRNYDIYLERHDKGLRTNTDQENHHLVQSVVASMFDSDWKLDALAETRLSEVQMPAAIFWRDPADSKIKPWTGPKPGDAKELPAVNVLVRRPWPGALIHSLPPSKPSRAAMSYIIKNHPQRGKFLPQKAKEIGVPVTKFSLLTSGTPVTLENGRTVQPQDVLAPGKPGGGFAVVDIPSVSYVKPLTARPEWESPTVMEGIGAIFWILGPGVAGNDDLQSFMRKLQKLKHIVSSPDHCPNHIVFESSANATLRLATIDPARFGILDYQNLVKTGPIGTDVALPGQILNLEPGFAWDPSTKAPSFDVPKVVQDACADTETQMSAKKVQETIRSPAVQKEIAAQSLPGLNNELITLGTGSAAPSKHRNVSATLLRVPGVGSYLLDAGENTLGQLSRIYSPSELQEVLKDLRMIWISHMHADHHLGLTSMIRAWYKAKHPSGAGPRTEPTLGDIMRCPSDFINKDKLAVVASEHMIQWLREYSQIEDFGWDQVVGLEMRGPAEAKASGRMVWELSGETMWLALDNPDEPLREALVELTGLVDLQSVTVQHCHGAMAVSITFADGFKMSYSGDCRPSKRFAEIGKGSTVLLHEATFEDDLVGDAKAKKHSTTSEAIQVGLAMNASRIILTHFSQRYQKLPNMEAVQKYQLQFEDVKEGEGVEMPFDQADGVAETDEATSGAVANSDDTMEIMQEEEQEETPAEATCAEKEDSTAEASADSSAIMPAQSNGASGAKGTLQGVKIGVAFDYMRVKVKDIALLERFTPTFSKLLDSSGKD